MNDPRRLVDETTDDLERALLRSFVDKPSDEARKRTAIAVGLTAGGAVDGSSAAHAAPAATAPAAKTALVFKAAAALTLVGAIAIVAVQYRSDAKLGPTGPTTAVQEEPAAAAVTPAAEPVAPLPPPSIAEPTPPTPAPAPAPAPARVREPANRRTVAPPTEPAPPEPSLAAEIVLVDEARRQLRAHEPDAAIAVLDEHDRDFPHGVLAPEADALRIEATLMRGDRAAASALAERFFAKYPRSPLGKRIRSLLADETNP